MPWHAGRGAVGPGMGHDHGVEDLPDIDPSPAGRADAAALAALALIPPSMTRHDARTRALAAITAAALARSTGPAECLGHAMRVHLTETRAARHGTDTAPARPSRDEVAAFAGPVAAAMRDLRREPAPPLAITRRVDRWCAEHGGETDRALADLVRAALSAARWTDAEPGLVLAAALVRLPGSPGAGRRVLEAAADLAIRPG